MRPAGWSPRSGVVRAPQNCVTATAGAARPGAPSSCGGGRRCRRSVLSVAAVLAARGDRADRQYSQAKEDERAEDVENGRDKLPRSTAGRPDVEPDGRDAKDDENRDRGEAKRAAPVAVAGLYPPPPAAFRPAGGDRAEVRFTADDHRFRGENARAAGSVSRPQNCPDLGAGSDMPGATDRRRSSSRRLEPQSGGVRAVTSLRSEERLRLGRCHPVCRCAAAKRQLGKAETRRQWHAIAVRHRRRPRDRLGSFTLPEFVDRLGSGEVSEPVETDPPRNPDMVDAEMRQRLWLTQSRVREQRAGGRERGRRRPDRPGHRKPLPGSHSADDGQLHAPSGGARHRGQRRKPDDRETVGAVLRGRQILGRRPPLVGMSFCLVRVPAQPDRPVPPLTEDNGSTNIDIRRITIGTSTTSR